MYSKQNILLIMNFEYVRSMCCWGGGRRGKHVCYRSIFSSEYGRIAFPNLGSSILTEEVGQKCCEAYMDQQAAPSQT